MQNHTIRIFVLFKKSIGYYNIIIINWTRGYHDVESTVMLVSLYMKKVQLPYIYVWK